MNLYRYEIEYSNPDNLGTDIYLSTYPVVRETEHTYFIKENGQWGKEKRVLKLKTFPRYQQTGKDTKRFAYASKLDAQLNFIARTKKRIGWYKYWLKECEEALKLVEKGYLEELK